MCINSIRWEHGCERYVIKRAEGGMESYIRLICSILQAYINALWIYGCKLYLHACSHHSEDGHMSGRNMSVTTTQFNYVHNTKVYLLVY